MKINKKLLLVTSAVCLVPVIAGLILYPSLPDQIATHWDFSGNVNGYSSKFVGAIVLPLGLFVLNLLMPFLLKTDPKNANMSEKLVAVVMWIIPAIALLCSGVTLSAAKGITMPIEIIMPLLIGLMFVIIGNYLPKTKQSYTMGIKLPWTLASEENWNRTHRLGGFIWVVGGLVIMASSFMPGGYIVFIAVTGLMVFIPIVYSYLFYLKESKDETK